MCPAPAQRLLDVHLDGHVARLRADRFGEGAVEAAVGLLDEGAREGGERPVRELEGRVDDAFLGDRSGDRTRRVLDVAVGGSGEDAALGNDRTEGAVVAQELRHVRAGVGSAERVGGRRTAIAPVATTTEETKCRKRNEEDHVLLKHRRSVYERRRILSVSSKRRGRSTPYAL